MACKLFVCSNVASSFYESPILDASKSVWLMRSRLRTVMADSSTISNVDKPLVKSVVEPSTTDVDVNTKPALTPASSGIILNANKAPSQITENPCLEISCGKGGGPVGIDSDAVGHMNGMDSTDPGLKLDVESISAPTSRPGSVSPTKTDGSRLLDRKSSVKKPTFKPVSLNKTFLKEQTSTGPVANPSSSTLPGTKGNVAFSHQPAPRGLTVSKLKLVKTGGTSQSSRPGAAGSLSTGIKRNEQAQPVWNKNQPVPPPPVKETKDVTDEELKKEFGIHMASRLGPEGTGAKWADIDDDDDDWVPEVPEKWGDALKLPSSTDVTPVVSQPPPAQVEQVAAPQAVNVSPPPKTPLLLAPKEETRPKTLITERLSSKPVEKPAPPVLRASPWGKVPPPPAQSLASQSRDLELPRRSTYGTESPMNHSSGQPHGMKEVAADAYTRSWRDGNLNHGPRERELFNSETGQLETVPESRNKGPRCRAEGSVEKPSLLQRPTGLPLPAEPSPAFQQHRSSMVHHRPDDYRRRRTSSNVSGGSGSTGRRPSFSKFGVDQPATPDDGRFPPRPGPPSYTSTDVYQEHHGQAVPLTRPEGLNHVSCIQGPSPVVTPTKPLTPDTPIEDLVAKQERIMKEGRELARKRRQEEEAKDEAAKKERLRVKLEELERMANEKLQEAERQAAEEARLAEEQAKEVKRAEEERVLAEKKAEEACKAAEANRVSERAEDSCANPPPSQPQGRRSLNPMPTKNFHGPNGRDSKDQPWKHVPSGNDRYTSWGGASNSGQGSGPNLWGPIEKPKFQGLNGVGNGTFDNRFPGFSTRPHPPAGAYPQHARDDRRRGPPTSPGLSRSGISADDRAQAVNRWIALPGKIQEDEAEQRRKGREEYLARQAEEIETSIKRAPIVQPKISETWRKVEIREGETDRKLLARRDTPREDEQAPPAEQLSGGLLVTTTVANAEGALAEPVRHVDSARNVPRGPAATRPASRFFPAAAGNLIAQHLGTRPKPTEEPTSRRLGPLGSPPPPMSAEHPVHGDTNSRVVQLPPHHHYRHHPHGGGSPTLYMNGHQHPKSPRFSGVQDFEAVQQKILGMTQKHSPPQQTAKLQPQPPKGVASKDFCSTKSLYDGSPERAGLRRVTVSLPLQPSGDPVRQDEYKASFLTKPDNEEFFHELFGRDFGSTPTVRLPNPPPAIYANNHAKKGPVMSKPHKKPPPRWQLQTTDIFNPFGHKDFVSDGKKFVPVHLPGGAAMKVISHEGKRSLGNRRRFPQPRQKNNPYAGGSPGNHIGRGSGGGMGRRVADPVQ